MMIDALSVSEQLPTILCCICATPMQSNGANICATCLRSQTDITANIAKEYIIQQCRGCLKWLRPPWAVADLESRELLALCLKKINNLNEVKLVDAGWIWTEPHSKRLKVKLTVQKEVLSKVVIQQLFVVTFIVRNQQCDECQSSFTNHSWKAVVQVRQKVSHKRTFYYLEQLILKHQAHAKTSNIESQPNGVDFFFTERNYANRFVDFLQECVPIKIKTAKKLISADNHSNTYNFKFTFSIEIAPVCKDDLVALPLRLSQKLAGISTLCLVTAVSSSIHVLDPLTLQTAEIDSEKYWRFPFQGMRSAQSLTEYTVLDVTPIQNSKKGGRPSHFNAKSRLVEVEVVRNYDFGVNDTRFIAISQLGNVLHVGDTVLGYDLTCSVFNDNDLRPLQESGTMLPDVILVKKKYLRSSTKRHWKLKNIEGIKENAETNRKTDQAKDATEYEQFLDDLEIDDEMRGRINLYKNEAAQSKHSGAGASDANPQDYSVPISELLDELSVQERSSTSVAVLSVEEASKSTPWELEEL